jgi:hypothetical protein
MWSNAEPGYYSRLTEDVYEYLRAKARKAREYFERTRLAADGHRLA